MSSAHTDQELLDEAKIQLKIAYASLSKGDGSLSITRQSIAALKEQIEWLDARIARTARSGIRVRGVTFK
jgi:hypothetical protein